MPSHDEQQVDLKRGDDVRARLRIVMGTETISSFARRIGISRQWLHDILSEGGGRGARGANVAILSSIADSCGYSLEWLATGKGMPNDRWNKETALVPRVVPLANARGAITLKKLDDLVLVSASLLRGLAVEIESAAVIGGPELQMPPLIGPSDDSLIDLSDHDLVDGGIFVVQVKNQVMVRRAFRTQDHAWILGSEGSSGGEPRSLVSGPHRVLARVRMIWKKL